MQSATRESVAAIKEISSTIGQISEIASTIATAVEQQGAEEVANNIPQVNSEAGQTGAASAEVLSSARTLSAVGARLREELDRFMGSVRAA